MIALKKGNESIAKMLIEAGARIDLENQDGVNVMVQVIKDGNMAALKFLLRHGGRLDSRSSNGTSLLSIAAAAGNLPLMRDILDAGVAVDAADRNGKSALHHAAENGQLEAVMMLAQDPESLNRCDKQGRSAAMSAARSGQLETLQWLCDNKAVFSASDAEGSNMLMYAAQAPNRDLMDFVAARLLPEHSHLLNARNLDGDTALIVGARNYVEADSHPEIGFNQLDILSTLMEYGADAALKNNQGADFLDAARQEWRRAFNSPDAQLPDKKAQRAVALCVHFAPAPAKPFQGNLQDSQTEADRTVKEDHQAFADLYSPERITSVFHVAGKVADELEDTVTQESEQNFMVWKLNHAMKTARAEQEYPMLLEKHEFADFDALLKFLRNEENHNTVHPDKHVALLSLLWEFSTHRMKAGESRDLARSENDAVYHWLIVPTREDKREKIVPWSKNPEGRFGNSGSVQSSAFGPDYFAPYRHTREYRTMHENPRTKAVQAMKSQNLPYASGHSGMANMTASLMDWLDIDPDDSEVGRPFCHAMRGFIVGSGLHTETEVNASFDMYLKLREQRAVVYALPKEPRFAGEIHPPEPE